MMQIDALKAYKEYLAAGFTEDQATTSVAATYTALDGLATKEDLNRIALATKEDLNRIALATKGDLSNLEAKLENKIDNIESKLENKIDNKFNLLIGLGAGMFWLHTLPVVETLRTANPDALKYGLGWGLGGWALYLLSKYLFRKK